MNEPDPNYGRFPNDTTISPARRMWLITPDDDTPVARLPKAIRADSDGVVVLLAVDSDVSVTINVVAGEQLPVRVSHILVGTTATLHGLA